MIAAGVIGMLCGAALGLKFKVFFLVPVVLLASVATTAAVAAGLLPSQQACADLLAWSLALELAYAAMMGLAGARQS